MSVSNADDAKGKVDILRSQKSRHLTLPVYINLYPLKVGYHFIKRVHVAHGRVASTIILDFRHPL
jgi:hypothetical protein